MGLNWILFALLVKRPEAMMDTYCRIRYQDQQRSMCYLGWTQQIMRQGYLYSLSLALYSSWDVTVLLCDRVLNTTIAELVSWCWVSNVSNHLTWWLCFLIGGMGIQPRLWDCEVIVSSGRFVRRSSKDSGILQPAWAFVAVTQWPWHCQAQWSCGLAEPWRKYGLW